MLIEAVLLLPAIQEFPGCAADGSQGRDKPLPIPFHKGGDGIDRVHLNRNVPVDRREIARQILQLDDGRQVQTKFPGVLWRDIPFPRRRCVSSDPLLFRAERRDVESALFNSIFMRADTGVAAAATTLACPEGKSDFNASTETSELPMRADTRSV